MKLALSLIEEIDGLMYRRLYYNEESKTNDLKRKA